MARALAEAFQTIINLHRVEFTPACRPVVGPPSPPDRSAIYPYFEQKALAGISLLNRRGKKEAKERAASWTESEIQRQWAAATQQHVELQQYYNERWHRLCANDPDVVMETLDEAFEDDEAPSAAIGVDGSEVALVILVPSITGAVPEQWPTRTQAGDLSLK